MTQPMDDVVTAVFRWAQSIEHCAVLSPRVSCLRLVADSLVDELANERGHELAGFTRCGSVFGWPRLSDVSARRPPVERQSDLFRLEVASDHLWFGDISVIDEILSPMSWKQFALSCFEAGDEPMFVEEQLSAVLHPANTMRRSVCDPIDRVLGDLATGARLFFRAPADRYLDSLVAGRIPPAGWEAVFSIDAVRGVSTLSELDRNRLNQAADR